jgi:hypothetical protein
LPGVGGYKTREGSCGYGLSFRVPSRWTTTVQARAR